MRDIGTTTVRRQLRSLYENERQGSISAYGLRRLRSARGKLRDQVGNSSAGQHAQKISRLWKVSSKQWARPLTGDYEIKTCMPDYYKWTQWIFLQLYKNGLAYRKEAPVNWCPSCNTVLANEQVVDGACERCHTTVMRKNLTQWFFKITKYAEELLDGLDTVDWPEKTKAMQRNWIGKSSGGEIEFELESGDKFKVFTTRADTVFGVSYVILAPEHPLVDKITTDGQKAAVEAYKLECSKASEIERLSTTREKTGVFTGAYCINPVNGDKSPPYG